MTPASSLHEILGGGRNTLDNAEGPPSQATIYIVRHGATKLNNQTDLSEDRIRGWSNVPLVEEGREEARRAAAKLKGKDIGAIVSSDLSRAHETAEIIGRIIGLTPQFSHKLRPWNLGEMQGVSTKEALPKIAQYVRAAPDRPVPQGESFNQFKARTFEGFAEALAAYPGKPVLIVTHHRDERLIEAWDAAGQPPDHSIDLDEFLQKGDPPGGIKILRTTAAALKGNGMMRGNRPIGGTENPALGSADRFRQKWAEAGKMPAPLPEQEGMAGPGPVMGPTAAAANTLAHGRAIAGAKALHAVGHISQAARDRHIAKSQKAIGRKPFGAFAP